MKRNREVNGLVKWRVSYGVLLLLGFTAGCSMQPRCDVDLPQLDAETKGEIESEAAPEYVQVPPHIDKQAVRVLKAASEYLREAKQFLFEARVSNEDVYPSGFKLQRNKQVSVYLKRPNKLRVRSLTSEQDFEFFFTGSFVILVDRIGSTSTMSKLSGDIDRAIDFTRNHYRVSLPLADLLAADPFARIDENIHSAYYVNEEVILGKSCHHLAIRQKNVDWQVWIENGEMTVPRKFVITYKNEKGMPQYSALFPRWDMNVRISDLVFDPTTNEDIGAK